MTDEPNWNIPRSLPRELLATVFSFIRLGPRFGALLLVCKKWHYAARLRITLADEVELAEEMLSSFSAFSMSRFILSVYPNILRHVKLYTVTEIRECETLPVLYKYNFGGTVVHAIHHSMLWAHWPPRMLFEYIDQMKRDGGTVRWPRGIASCLTKVPGMLDEMRARLRDSGFRGDVARELLARSKDKLVYSVASGEITPDLDRMVWSLSKQDKQILTEVAVMLGSLVGLEWLHEKKLIISAELESADVLIQDWALRKGYLEVSVRDV